MKTVILCGGVGTRMKEETEFKPKPMVTIGGKPMLWHIMKIYAHYGHNDFIVALGYKGEMIKEYFLRWRAMTNDFTLHTKENKMIMHNNGCEDFKITFVDTGLESLTGERVRRLKPYLQDEQNFMVTYGDGVGDVNIQELIDFHKKQNTLGTITAVKPNSRFGFLDADHDNNKIRSFWQDMITPEQVRFSSKDLVNGGFMVFDNAVLDMIRPDSMIEEVFVPLSESGNLSFYHHRGKWKCMDTHKEAQDLNNLWQSDPFWKVWQD